MGYKNYYLIYPDGRLYSTLTSKFLSTYKERAGYFSVRLSVDTVERKHYIHRLVASHFIPNPNNYPQVNHKNSDKSNNNFMNLEWCTAKENMNHFYRQPLSRTLQFRKPVKQYSLNGIFIKEWGSIAEACRNVRVYSSNIASCIKGKLKQAGGYVWKYA